MDCTTSPMSLTTWSACNAWGLTFWNAIFVLVIAGLLLVVLDEIVKEVEEKRKRKVH